MSRYWQNTSLIIQSLKTSQKKTLHLKSNCTSFLNSFLDDFFFFFFFFKAPFVRKAALVNKRIWMCAKDKIIFKDFVSISFMLQVAPANCLSKNNGKSVIFLRYLLTHLFPPILHLEFDVFIFASQSWDV